MSVAHQQIFTTTSFSNFHHSTIDVGDHNVGARNIVVELGNDGVGIGNSYMCIYRKFGLKM